jgi:pyrroloquinoline quinone biosynthesis protein B
MLVRLLGSAAGGGIPQWNCGCRQCDGARRGVIEKRTQCSVAVSADGGRWVLINASPDLRSQLLCFPAQPPPGRRETPIEAVLLTDADLDHILGLFLLRESNAELPIHASRAIRKAVEEGLRLTQVLDKYCGIRWLEAPPDYTPLFFGDGSASGLEYKGVEVQGLSPRYQGMGQGCPRIAYVLRELNTTKSVLIAPGVSTLEPQLLAELNRADSVFFDGTFWSSDDFQKSGVPDHSIGELLRSHLPISTGSLKTLAEIPAKLKVYLHINNTNPILWNDSSERKQLEGFGIQVATDGTEFEL